MKIKAYVNYNDRTKTHYYNEFEVIEELPKLEKELAKNENFKNYQDAVINIRQVDLDCEQGNDEVYNYDFYEVELFDNIDYFDGYDEEDCIYYEYVCVHREEN